MEASFRCLLEYLRKVRRLRACSCSSWYEARLVEMPGGWCGSNRRDFGDLLDKDLDLSFGGWIPASASKMVTIVTMLRGESLGM